MAEPMHLRGWCHINGQMCKKELKHPAQPYLENTLLGAIILVWKRSTRVTRLCRVREESLFAENFFPPLSQKTEFADSVHPRLMGQVDQSLSFFWGSSGRRETSGAVKTPFTNANPNML